MTCSEGKFLYLPGNSTYYYKSRYQDVVVVYHSPMKKETFLVFYGRLRSFSVIFMNFAPIIFAIKNPEYGIYNYLYFNP